MIANLAIAVRPAALCAYNCASLCTGIDNHQRFAASGHSTFVIPISGISLKWPSVASPTDRQRRNDARERLTTTASADGASARPSMFLSI